MNAREGEDPTAGETVFCTFLARAINAMAGGDVVKPEGVYGELVNARTTPFVPGSNYLGHSLLQKDVPSGNGQEIYDGAMKALIVAARGSEYMDEDTTSGI